MAHRNSETPYDTQWRAAELQDGATHAHRVAEHQGKPEHLTGSEHSRQALEHNQGAPLHMQTATVGHGIAAFGREEIAQRAYQLWQARGCPYGSPEEDWLRATEELRLRKI
jgi:hypothetical protein